MTETGDVEILKRDANGRVRTPPEKREAILDEFEGSGMSGARFARHHGISYQTFASWRRKRALRHRAADQHSGTGSEAGLALAEVVLSESRQAMEASDDDSAEPELRVELPGCVRLTLTSTRQAPLAAALIHALRTQH